MKNRLSLFGIASLIVLGSCGNAGTQLDLYTDSDYVQDGDVAISMNAPREQSQSFTVTFTTTKTEPVKLTFGNWMIYRESDNSEYGATCTPLGLSKEQTVNSERPLYLVFRTELPTAFDEEHYKLVLHYDKTTLTCHLYDLHVKSYESINWSDYL